MTHKARKSRAVTTDLGFRAFRRQINKIGTDCVRRIKRAVRSSSLEFYASAYVDRSEPDNMLRIAKLSEPVRVPLMVTDGDDVDDDGCVGWCE